MIPKTIYFYWGNKILPFLRYMTLYSFCKLNPDWKVILILKDNSSQLRRLTTGEIVFTEYTGKDYLPEVEKLNVVIREFSYDFITNIDSCMVNQHIKDMLNWYLIDTEGGFVADMDVLFVRSFNEMYSRFELDKADMALVCYSGLPLANYIPVSFMGGSTNNAFYKEVFERAKKTYNPQSYQCCGTFSISYPNLMAIKNAYSTLKVVQLPDIVIYPYILQHGFDGFNEFIHEQDRFGEISGIADMIGIHWYGAGVPLELIQSYDEVTSLSKNSTLGRALQKVLKL